MSVHVIGEEEDASSERNQSPTVEHVNVEEKLPVSASNSSLRLLICQHYLQLPFDLLNNSFLLGVGEGPPPHHSSYIYHMQSHVLPPPNQPLLVCSITHGFSRCLPSPPHFAHCNFPALSGIPPGFFSESSKILPRLRQPLGSSASIRLPRSIHCHHLA